MPNSPTEPERVSWYGPPPKKGLEPAEPLRRQDMTNTERYMKPSFLGSRRWEDFVMKRTRPKVAMVGYAEGNQLVPWKDEGLEMWACNDLPQRFERQLNCRFDRVFQFHSDHDRMRVAWPPWDEHLSWLYRPHDFPVYMQEAYDNVPSSVRFPKELIEGMIPHGWYFAHTFCWMIAFAILLEFEEIHLYGVGASAGEPLSAMACQHFWMGVAEGKGIPIVVHGEGELFMTDQIVRSQKQYGYDLTRLVLQHEGPDPASGWFEPAIPGGTDRHPELDHRLDKPRVDTRSYDDKLDHQLDKPTLGPTLADQAAFLDGAKLDGESREEAGDADD